MTKKETTQADRNTGKKIQEQISNVRKTVADYKLERKESWKLFKDKVKEDIDDLKKSLSKLSQLKSKD